MRFSFKKALASVLSVALVLSTFVGVLTVNAADVAVAGTLTMEDVNVTATDENKFDVVANIALVAESEYVEVAYELDALPEGITLDSVAVDAGEVYIDAKTGAIHASVVGPVSAIAVTMTFVADGVVEPFTLKVAAIDYADVNSDTPETAATINIEDVAEITVVSHGPSNTWKNTGDHCYQVCQVEGCEEQFNYDWHSDSSSITAEATCCTAGSKLITCARCSRSYSVAIDATGDHTPEYKDNEDGTHSVTCTTSNTVVIEAEDHTFTDGTCVCGAVEDVKALAVVEMYNGTKVEATYEYDNIEEALKNAAEFANIQFNGAYCDPKVTINDNVTLTADIEVAPYVTLALGDYTVTKGDYEFNITASGKVTANAAISYFQGNPFITETVKSGVYTYATNVQMDLYSKNLTISDQIFINFEANKNVTYTGTVEYGLDYYWVEKPDEIITILPEDFTTNTTKTFKVATKGIPAKDMSNEIVARYWAKTTVDGDEYYAYSNTVEYSIVIYAQAMFEKSEDEELITMLKDMLNYGAYFQIYKDHRPEDLANAILDEADRVLPTKAELQANTDAWIAPLAVSDLADYSPAANYIDGMSLELLDMINIKYTLLSAPAAGVEHKMCVWTKAEYEALTAGCTTDEEISAILTMENCNNVLDLSENGNYFIIEGIASKRYADTIVTRQMYVDANGELQLDYLYSYSPLTYCINNINKINDDVTGKNAGLRDTCKALMLFAKSARDYFNYTVDAG